MRRDPDGSVLVDLRSGTAHLLNHTALAVWELCDGETMPVEMIAAVCDLCGAAPEEVEQDIVRALDDLARANLVSWLG